MSGARARWSRSDCGLSSFLLGTHRPFGTFEYNVSAMDVSAVARWRVVCLLMLGAFLGLSGVVYAVGLLPGDVAVHGEILEARGTLAHAAARSFDYGGQWLALRTGIVAILASAP